MCHGIFLNQETGSGTKSLAASSAPRSGAVSIAARGSPVPEKSVRAWAAPRLSQRRKAAMITIIRPTMAGSVLAA